MSQLMEDKALLKVLIQAEAVLRAQLALYQGMLDLLGRKRSAMRAARHAELAALVVEENKLVQRVSELEKHRLALAAELTRRLAPGSAAPLRLSEVAGLAPQPWGAKLEALGAELRRVMARVKVEADVARRAAQAVLRHVTGMVQAVTAKATGTATYGPRGDGGRKRAVVSTFVATA